MENINKLETSLVVGAHRGLKSINLLTELKNSLVNEADSLNFELMMSMINGLGQSIKIKMQNSDLNKNEKKERKKTQLDI